MKKLIVLAFGLSLALTGCKKNNAVGTYTLNKEEMTKAMKAEVDKLPKEKQGMAKFGMMMIQSMEMTIKLENGGVATAESTMSFMGKKKQEVNTGTWKADGDKVMITTTKERKNKEGKVEKKEQTITCTVSGKTLRCQNEARKSKSGRPQMVLVFNKA